MTGDLRKVGRGPGEQCVLKAPLSWAGLWKGTDPACPGGYRGQSLPVNSLLGAHLENRGGGYTHPNAKWR